MDLHLKERVCLVTGASTGIGRATAIALAAEGALVVATARSLDALDTLPAAIQHAGGAAPVLLAADFARDAGAERLAALVSRRRPRPLSRSLPRRRRVMSMAPPSRSMAVRCAMLFESQP